MSKKLYFFFYHYKFLICMILLLLFLREGMIIFDMWGLEDGGDLPEALISGSLAFDIIDGSWRGWPTYLYVTWGGVGAEVLVSVLVLPLYFLFGGSLFVLAQIPILYSIGILILIYYVGDTWFRRDIANIAAALFVCAPFIVHTRLLYPYGSHFCTSFFALCASVVFFHIRLSKSRVHAWVLSGLLGLISGIGIFQSELYLLTLFFIVLFWFIHNRFFFFSIKFIFFLLFLGLGLIPYYYLDHTAFRVFLEMIQCGRFSGTFAPGQLYLPTMLDLMSVLFSPFNSMIFSQLPGMHITLVCIGLLGLFEIYIVFKQESIRYTYFYTYFLLYSLSYIVIILCARATTQYFLYVIFPHATLLSAVLISEIRKRCYSFRRLIPIVFNVFLLLCCVSNVYAIVKHFEPHLFIPQLQKQLSRNGCCFY